MADPRMVTTMWHPLPLETVVTRDNGDVRVLVGEAQYQLSTGDIIK